MDTRPKPKRLRANRTHRKAALAELPAEQQPVAEQVLKGGIPAVRAAGVHWRPSLQVRHPAVRRLVALSGWTLGYVVANQVAVAVDDPSGGDQSYREDLRPIGAKC